VLLQSPTWTVWTPYVLTGWALIVGLVGWLIKEQIKQGKDLVILQTAFRIYVETKLGGAAKVLDSPNPTPPEIRLLLRQWQQGTLDAEGRETLISWARAVRDNPARSRSERNAATDVLASIKALKFLDQYRLKRSSPIARHN